MKIQLNYCFSAFVLREGKFNEKNMSINIKEYITNENHRELTFEKEIPIESPLNYKADFTPSKSCRIIIIKDEKLKGEEIRPTDIKRKEENFSIESDDDDDVMPTPGDFNSSNNINFQ